MFVGVDVSISDMETGEPLFVPEEFPSKDNDVVLVLLLRISFEDVPIDLSPSC